MTGMDARKSKSGDSLRSAKEMTAPINGAVPKKALVRAAPRLLRERIKSTMLRP